MSEHPMPGGQMLLDRDHCSRYNQNTGRLTREMFEAVFERAVALYSEREEIQPSLG